MSGAAPARVAVVGAGLIGRRHAEIVHALPETTLAAIVDPAPAAQALAASFGVSWRADLADLIRRDGGGDIDGVIIATPNQTHADIGLQAVAAGLPMLVEKPIADSVAAAVRLVREAEAGGVPILVGHHRRHNPIVQRAKADIVAGRIGRIVAIHAFCWLCKPDAYFDIAWRREPGGGPIYINLIHDMDLIRWLAGDIVAAQAIESAAVRGHAVEDTAVALLRFASGALGTISISDAIAAPWSWELTAGENAAYPRTDQPCYLIGGTHGSLSIPRGEIWRHPDGGDWMQPIAAARSVAPDADPLVRQAAHFADVIRGATPLVTGAEGLKSLMAVEAVKRSAATGVETRIADMTGADS